MTGACALIPAAGRGVRFGAPENKVFAPLLGHPLLAWTLKTFAESAEIESIVLIGGEFDLERLRALGQAYGGGKLHAVVRGGADRQESVRNGLAALPPGTSLVVIHDGARACLDQETLEGTLTSARIFGGAIAAARVSDTLVRGRNGKDDFPSEPVSREFLWSVQTPQVFQYNAIMEAHARAAADAFQATDDAALLRRLGHPVAVFRSSTLNVKVTRPEDIDLAEAILTRRGAELPTPNPPSAVVLARPKIAPQAGPIVSAAAVPAPAAVPASATGTPPLAPEFRIGHGYDVHVFATGRKLYLGGVEFPEAERGLVGHSDADVVLHALCDSLLGAAGLGDIGVLFPPSDPAHKDRRSTEFLTEVYRRIAAEGWQVGNVDITILAETPRVMPRAAQMRAAIARALAISPDRVGIKATTSEGLGFVGRGEGIAAYASALINRPNT